MTPGDWTEVARDLDDRGSHREAARAWRRALEQTPRSGMVRTRLAFDLLRLDRPGAAVRLVRGPAREPGEYRSLALLVLGLAQRDLGSATAPHTLRAFLRAAPDHPAAPEVRRLLGLDVTAPDGPERTRMVRVRAWRSWAAPAAAAVLLLAGCSSGAPDERGSAAGDTPSQRQVRVGLTEWTVVVGAAAVVPGRVRLVVTNTGATEHDLVVRGRAGQWRTPVLDPGDQAALAIRTEAGEQLALWCDEPGHRAQGMHTTLPVAPGSGGAS